MLRPVGVFCSQMLPQCCPSRDLFAVRSLLEIPMLGSALDQFSKMLGGLGVALFDRVNIERQRDRWRAVSKPCLRGFDVLATVEKRRRGGVPPRVAGLCAG